MTDDITDRVKDWTNTAEYAVAHRVGVPFGASEVKMLRELLAEVERLRACIKGWRQSADRDARTMEALRRDRDQALAEVERLTHPEAVS